MPVGVQDISTATAIRTGHVKVLAFRIHQLQTSGTKTGVIILPNQTMNLYRGIPSKLPEINLQQGNLNDPCKKKKRPGSSSRDLVKGPI